MTYEALKINAFVRARKEADQYKTAISAIKELHKKKSFPQNCADETCCPAHDACEHCNTWYPCPTIKAIEEAIK